MTLEPLVRWYDETPDPERPHDHGVSIGMNDMYRPTGIIATLQAYEIGSRRITPNTSVSLVEENLRDLIPTEATAFEIGFTYVGSPQLYPGQASVMILHRDGSPSTYVHVEMPDEHAVPTLDAVRAILNEFPLVVNEPPVGPLKVFIGHGGDRKWEVVRDLIAAQEGYEVVAFESEPRAGSINLDVVEGLITSAGAAVIVMTGTDRVEGGLRARQNVIHELGFAQGRLGRFETIVMAEEGVERFTNLGGLNEIRFPTGQIHTANDEVLAALALRARARGA
ncbi:TIR domain-containing protein [Microbacterium sp. SLBN-146]|uniref:TIR domain-containing protein n=1 Tax=Microbacterium sp. SLBN-146 TaxID=2768457 RepID=UPI0013593AD9|nr:TIR domain-containing protein [Microbacterium sp. SLBN-146]